MTLAAQRGTAGTSDHVRRLLAAAHANIIAGDGTLAGQLLDGLDAGGALGARVNAERVEAILLSNDAPSRARSRDAAGHGAIPRATPAGLRPPKNAPQDSDRGHCDALVPGHHAHMTWVAGYHGDLVVVCRLDDGAYV